MTWNSFGDPVYICACWDDMEYFFQTHPHWSKKLVPVPTQKNLLRSFTKEYFQWLNANLGPMEIFINPAVMTDSIIKVFPPPRSSVQAHPDTRWFGQLSIKGTTSLHYYAFKNEEEAALFKLFFG